MTEIAKASHDEMQRAKWRLEAERIAEHLKGIDNWGGRGSVTAGIVFDDAVLRVKLDVSLIERLSPQSLGQFIFEAALGQITDHRAAGESAGAQKAPGMECGHAAPQASDHDSSSSSAVSGPAAPAVSERCWRRIPPSFSEQCPHAATGGVRLKLYPAASIQKRYGKRDMLALIFDLPVCAGCFSQMSAIEVINNQPPDMWKAFSKLVQQRNNGVLPIKEQSEIEHLPFDDPEYVLLRQGVASKAQG